MLGVPEVLEAVLAQIAQPDATAANSSRAIAAAGSLDKQEHLPAVRGRSIRATRFSSGVR